jgi:hypothetical protein
VEINAKPGAFVKENRRENGIYTFAGRKKCVSKRKASINTNATVGRHPLLI